VEQESSEHRIHFEGHESHEGPGEGEDGYEHIEVEQRVEVLEVEGARNHDSEHGDVNEEYEATKITRKVVKGKLYEGADGNSRSYEYYGEALDQGSEAHSGYHSGDLHEKADEEGLKHHDIPMMSTSTM